MEKAKYYCDLCRLDGEEDILAVAYYTAEDGESYDVCEKHKKIAEESGMHLFTPAC